MSSDELVIEKQLGRTSKHGVSNEWGQQHIVEFEPDNAVVEKLTLEEIYKTYGININEDDIGIDRGVNFNAIAIKRNHYRFYWYILYHSPVASVIHNPKASKADKFIEIVG